MANNGLEQEKMNNIKQMVDNGDISGAISQISPEMIENFSKMLSQNQSSNNSSNSSSNSSNNFNNSSSTSSSNGNQNTYKSSNNNTSSNSNNGFDFNNIDINTILKMKSVMEKMNDKNDPRANLLYSLKPYLRETKQEKLDQYVNLLNISKIADVLKNEKKADKNV